MNKVPFANCEMCPLRDAALVLGHGPTTATTAVVGEGPGKMEVAQGKPFVGPSGSMLTHALAQGGMARAAMWVTNATLCDPSGFRDDHRAAAVAEAASCCAPRLLEELRQHKIKRVLALGSVAANALSPEPIRITEAAGKRFVGINDLEVMPVIHPVSILRAATGAERPAVDGGAQFLDFMSQIRQSAHPRLPLPNVTHEVAQSVDDAVRMLNEIRYRVYWSYSHTGDEQPLLVTVDLETTGFDQFTSRIIALGIGTEDNPEHVYIIPEDYLYHWRTFQAMVKIVDEPGAQFCAHNATFERRHLRQWARVVADVDYRIDFAWDTMLMSWTLDERSGRHGLKALVSKYWEIDDYSEAVTTEFATLKANRKTRMAGIRASIKAHESAIAKHAAGKDKKLTARQKELVKGDAVLWSSQVRRLKDELATLERQGDVTYGDIDRDVLYDYLARDVAFTTLLHAQLLTDIYAQGLDRVIDTVLRPVNALIADMEYAGIYLDAKSRAELDAELESRIASLADELRRQTGDCSFNPGSSVQVANYLYNELGYIPHRGRRSTDEEAMQRIVDLHEAEGTDPPPFVAALLEWRGMSKLLSTYVRGTSVTPHSDGRIRYHINQIGTKTGRPSFSDPNMGNLPRPTPGVPVIRNMYGAAPGNLFVVADYSAAEVRWLARLSEDPTMCKVYQEGKDLHTEAAKLIFGDDVTERPTYDDLERPIAKQFNFGGVYNLFEANAIYRLLVKKGIKTFTRADVEHLLAEYKARFPRLYDWMLEVIEEVETYGYVDTFFGNLRRFGYLTNDNRKAIHREAINTKAQGPAAQLTWLAGVELTRRLKEAAIPGQVVVMVYDSLGIEVPEAQALDVAHLAIDVMVDTARVHLGDLVPFAADAKIGPTWGTAKKVK